MAERRREERGTEENSEANEVMHMGRRCNSPTKRSRIGDVTRLEDERGDGDSRTFRGWRRKQRVERVKANPTAMTP